MSPLLADGIGIEGIVVFGFLLFVLPILVIIALEWIVLTLVTCCGARRALRLAVVVNVASTLAGIPVKILFDTYYDRLIPSDLHLYFDGFLRFAILKYSVYFTLTLVVELVVAMRFVSGWQIRWRRLAAAVVMANLVTYALSSPLYYYATRPHYQAARLTADTSWAPAGLGPVFYLDSVTGYLMQIDANGENSRIVSPEAYVAADDGRRWDDHPITWSHDERGLQLFVTDHAAAVLPNHRLPRGTSTQPAAHPRDYPAPERSGDFFAEILYDMGYVRAIITRGANAYDKGEVRLWIADAPGIALLGSHRGYGEIAFLPNTHLCVLEDETFKAIYLLDPDTRTIGKLTDGACPMVLSKKYLHQ